MKKLLLAATLISLTSAGAAMAGGHAGNPAVSARQAHMTLYNFNAGYFFGMAQGKVEYDAATAQGAANNLAALANADQSRMWPQGSDSDSIENTRALPAIWTDFPDILDESKAMADAANALAAVAGDGKEAALAALGAVGKSCTSCHEKYRQPR